MTVMIPLRKGQHFTTDCKAVSVRLTGDTEEIVRYLAEDMDVSVKSVTEKRLNDRETTFVLNGTRAIICH